MPVLTCCQQKPVISTVELLCYVLPLPPVLPLTSTRNRFVLLWMCLSGERPPEFMFKNGLCVWDLVQLNWIKGDFHSGNVADAPSTHWTNPACSAQPYNVAQWHEVTNLNIRESTSEICFPHFPLIKLIHLELFVNGWLVCQNFFHTSPGVWVISEGLWK